MRTKVVNGVSVPLTAEEEAARDAEDAAFASATPITVEEIQFETKLIKAVMLVMRTYCNALHAGTYQTKTLQDLRNDFLSAWRSIA